MAIIKKTEGHLTITDLTDITDIYLQYGLALASATVTNSYTFSGTGEVGWSTTYPTWVPGYQVWIRQVRIKEGISNPEYGTPYIDTAVNQLNTRISSSETNITALQTKLRRIWINEITSGNYVAGTYAASGINGTTFIESNPQTYGYNTLLRHNALDLRYNTVKMTSLTTAALTFYIPTQDNSNNWIQGNKGLELSADGLKFFGFDNYIKSTDTVVDTLKSYYTRSVSTPYTYTLVTIPTGNPSTNNYYELEVAAELTSAGLKLIKGGIEAGDPNQSGFIYLSTEDYPLREFILTEDQTIDNTKTYYQFDSNSQTYIDVEEPDISEINTYYELTEASISINNYTPTKGNNNLGTISNPAWRQVIGTKFGVDSAGNLYASGANISGTIDASAGEIGRFIIANDLYSGNLGEENSVWVSIGTDEFASIGGTVQAINGWAFTAGEKFGVTKDGDLYASNATINGTLTITGGNSNIYTKDEADDIAQSIVEANIEDISKIIDIADWVSEYGNCKLTLDEKAQEGKAYFDNNKQIVVPAVNPSLQNYYELDSAVWELTEDTIVDMNKIYFNRNGSGPNFDYTIVEPIGNENPSNEGWYELSNITTYKQSTDTSLEDNKLYFLQVIQYESIENPTGNPQAQNWYELIDNEYITTLDTTVQEDKQYYIKSDIISYELITEYIPNPYALGLYELDTVNKSISNYINTYVKLDNGAIVIQADNTEASVHISLDGIAFKNHDGIQVANFAENITLGKENEASMYISSNGIILQDNNGTPIANFAQNIILGNQNEMYLKLSPGNSSNNTLSELGFYNGSGDTPDVPVAYVNSNILNINQGEIKEKLRIGQFEWRTQGTNRISLIYAPTQ